MKAYKHLVKYALGLGHTVSVDDGDYDDMPVVNSQGYKEIIDAIESLTSQISISRPPMGKNWGLRLSCWNSIKRMKSPYAITA